MSILSRNRLFTVDFLHPLKILFGFLDWAHIDAQPMLTEYRINRVTKNWVGHLCLTKLGEKYKLEKDLEMSVRRQTQSLSSHSGKRLLEPSILSVLQKRRGKTPSYFLASKEAYAQSQCCAVFIPHDTPSLCVCAQWDYAL